MLMIHQAGTRSRNIDINQKHRYKGLKTYIKALLEASLLLIALLRVTLRLIALLGVALLLVPLLGVIPLPTIALIMVVVMSKPTKATILDGSGTGQE